MQNDELMHNEWAERIHDGAVALMGHEIETFWRFNENFTTLNTIAIGAMVTGVVQFKEDPIFFFASVPLCVFMIYLGHWWKRGNRKVDARIERLIQKVTEIGQRKGISLFSEEVEREYEAALTKIFVLVARGFQILWFALVIYIVYFIDQHFWKISEKIEAWYNPTWISFMFN